MECFKQKKKILFGSKISFLKSVLLTVLPFPPGISGSLNFDEEETDEEEEEGKKLRSHSPYSEADRTNSAPSQKSITVCSSETSSLDLI